MPSFKPMGWLRNDDVTPMIVSDLLDNLGRWNEKKISKYHWWKKGLQSRAVTPPGTKRFPAAAEKHHISLPRQRLCISFFFAILFLFRFVFHYNKHIFQYTYYTLLHTHYTSMHLYN